MRITAKTGLWIASTGFVIAAGLAAGSAVGGATESSQRGSDRPDPKQAFVVQDGDQSVGSITLGELLAPPTVVDGEVRQAFYPDAGWPVHDDGGRLVGYFVPNYGFMSPDEASRFQADPSTFEPIATPAPAGAPLPEGFDPLASQQ